MAVSCPNINLKAFKDLVKAQNSELRAYALWNEFEGIVPEEYYKAPNIQQKGTNVSDTGTISVDGILSTDQIRSIENQLNLWNSDGTRKRFLNEQKAFDKVRELNKTIFKDSNYRAETVKMLDYHEDKTGNTVRHGIKVAPEPSYHYTKVEKPETNLSYSLNEAISRQEGLIAQFRKKIGEGTERKQALLSKIEKLEENVEALRADKGEEKLYDIMEGIYNEVNIRINSIKEEVENNLNEGQLGNLFNEMQELDMYIRTGEKLDQMFSDLIGKNVERDDISILEGKFKDAKSLHREINRELALNIINKSSFKVSYEDLYKSVDDASLWTTNVLSAGLNPSLLVKAADDIIKRQLYKRSQEYNAIEKKINDAVDKLLKKKGWSEKQLNESILQRNKDGKWTGGYVSPFRIEYWEERRKMFPKGTTASFNRFWKWYYNNTHIMTYDEYQRGKSSRFTKEEIELQQKKFDKYEEDKKAQEQYFIDHEGFEQGSEALKERMDRWEDAHSPYRYLEAIENNPYHRPPYRQRGHKYVMFKPKDKWRDSRFDKYAKDKDWMEFYNFMTEQLNENLNTVPWIDHFSPNYLPSVSKTWIERVRNAGGLKKLSALSKELSDAFLNEPIAIKSNRIVIGDTKSGKEIKTVPVRTFDNNLEIDDRLQDIRTLLTIGTKSAINYKVMTEVEPVIYAIQDVLADTINEVKTVDNRKGVSILRRLMNGQIDEREGLFNTQQHLANTVNSIIYGESAKPQGKLWDTYKDKKTYLPDQIEKQIQDEDGNIYQIIVNGKRLDVISSNTDDEGNIVSIEAGVKKTVYTSDITDNLIKYTYIKALAFPNVVTPAVNWFFGMISNLTYSSAKQNVTDKEIIKATGIVFGAIAKRRNVDKVYHFLRKVNAIEGIRENSYSRLSDKLTFLQSKTESLIRGAMAIGVLMHKKLTINGKEVSVWDAYEMKDGELVYKFGEEPQVVDETELYIKDENGNNIGVNMYKMANGIKEINDSLHGNYTDPLKAKKDYINRILILFKTWLFSTLEHRFGKERPSLGFDEKVKGRYRSFLKAETNEGVELKVKEILKILGKSLYSKNAWEGLSEVDKANLMRNKRELMFILSMYTLVMMLSSAVADEDDERYKYALNFLINGLSKAQADASFFLNPSSMTQVTGNIFTIQKTLEDIIRITDVSAKALQGDYYIKSGPWKDHLRVAKWGYQITPLASGGVSMYNYMTQDYSR